MAFCVGECWQEAHRKYSRHAVLCQDEWAAEAQSSPHCACQNGTNDCRYREQRFPNICWAHHEGKTIINGKFSVVIKLVHHLTSIHVDIFFVLGIRLLWHASQQSTSHDLASSYHHQSIHSSICQQGRDKIKPKGQGTSFDVTAFCYRWRYRITRLFMTWHQCNLVLLSLVSWRLKLIKIFN